MKTFFTLGALILTAQCVPLHAQTPNTDIVPPTAQQPIICRARYSMVSPPNPELQIGVLAIVPSSLDTTRKSAAGLATYITRAFAAGKWQRMEVFVFADRASAKAFVAYQIPRRSRSLQSADYAKLKAIWPKVLAYHISVGRNAATLYPQDAPNNWWRKIPSFPMPAPKAKR